MEKAILMSFKPKWVKMILSGEKQFEFRSNNVKNFKKGDKIYMYESSKRRKIIAEFIVGELYECHENIESYFGEIHLTHIHDSKIQYAIGYTDQYAIGYTDQPYAIEITELKIYDEPKDISEYLYRNKFIKEVNEYYRSRSCSMETARRNIIYIKNCIVKKAPQSFCYVVEVDNEREN